MQAAVTPPVLPAVTLLIIPAMRYQSLYEVSSAFSQIFKEMIPKKLHTDKGTEFINKFIRFSINLPRIC